MTQRGGRLIFTDGLNTATFRASIFGFNFPVARTYHGSKLRTYVGYIKEDFIHGVLAYDHDEKAVVQNVGLDDGAPSGEDHHGCPVILVDSEGYIHVFYGALKSHLHYKKSPDPEDISGLHDAQKKFLGSYVTYPHVCSVDINGTETFFILYRYGWEGAKDRFSRMTSTDGGENWVGAGDIIADFSGGVPQSRIPYLRGLAVGSDQSIHVTWCLYVSAENCRMHIYYAWTPDAGATWKKADGTTLSLPFTHETADKVLDTSDFNAYPKRLYKGSMYANAHPISMFLDSNDEPHILFWAGDKRLRLAEWDQGSSQWTFKTVAEDVWGIWHGSGVMVDDDFIIVYWPNSDGKIDVYVTEDGGDTWKNYDTLEPIKIFESEPWKTASLVPVYDVTNRTKGERALTVWAPEGYGYLYDEPLPLTVRESKNRFTNFIVRNGELLTVTQPSRLSPDPYGNPVTVYTLLEKDYGLIQSGRGAERFIIPGTSEKADAVGYFKKSSLIYQGCRVDGKWQVLYVDDAKRLRGSLHHIEAYLKRVEVSD